MVVAIILSGGNGTRLGMDIPKQYIKYNNHMIIEYSIDAVTNCNSIDFFCIVALPLWRQKIDECIGINSKHKFIGFADAGDNRQLSILNGLRFIKRFFEHKCITVDYVLIHDSARPNVNGEMFSHYIESLKGHDGVLPTLKMKDTIYYSQDGKSVFELLDRSKIFAGQAPEVFKFDKYLNANEMLSIEELKLINGSSEVAIKAGMDVVMVKGCEKNYKITTKEDLELFFKENSIDKILK